MSEILHLGSFFHLCHTSSGIGSVDATSQIARLKSLPRVAQFPSIINPKTRDFFSNSCRVHRSVAATPVDTHGELVRFKICAAAINQCKPD